MKRRRLWNYFRNAGRSSRGEGFAIFKERSDIIQEWAQSVAPRAGKLWHLDGTPDVKECNRIVDACRRLEQAPVISQSLIADELTRLEEAVMAVSERVRHLELATNCRKPHR